MSQDLVEGQAGRVDLRLLVVGGQPLVIAGLHEDRSGEQLWRRLEEGGLEHLDRFLGADLPKGARVGFALDTSELRLVDERDDPILRAPRAELDEGWIEAARRLRGTMTVVVSRLDFDAGTPPGELAQRVEERCGQRQVLGAIVGVVEERPSLPLLF